MFGFDPVPIKVGLQTQSQGSSMLGEILGSLASGALNFFGAQSANKANKKMAREQMKFQQNQAREAMMFGQASAQHQMDWQERMSNTSYQRAMNDMRQAGLNPIMAFNQGGAGTPGGASASGSAPSGASAQQVNELSGAVASAIDARRMSYELKNMEEQNKNLKSQNSLLSSQKEYTDKQADTEEWRKLKTVADIEKVQAETKKIDSDKIRQWVDTAGGAINPIKWLSSRLNK